MNYQTFLPASILSPYIINYWKLELFADSGFQEKEIILPDGNASLMFTDYTIRRTIVGQSNWTDLCGQVVFIGQKSLAVEYIFPQDQHTVTWGVRFQPAGLRAFSRMPMSESTNEIIDATCVFSEPVSNVMNMIQDDRSSADIQDGLNTFFLKQLMTHQTPLLTTGAMASTLAAKPQAIREIANQFRMSTRQMERHFKSYVGLSPKAYSCITRFNLAVLASDQEPNNTLAGISETSGYYDAVHLHRESIKICGLPPQEIFYIQRGQTRPLLMELIRQRMSSWMS